MTLFNGVANVDQMECLESSKHSRQMAFKQQHNMWCFPLHRIYMSFPISKHFISEPQGVKIHRRHVWWICITSKSSGFCILTRSWSHSWLSSVLQFTFAGGFMWKIWNSTDLSGKMGYFVSSCFLWLLVISCWTHAKQDFGMFWLNHWIVWSFLFKQSSICKPYMNYVHYVSIRRKKVKLKSTGSLIEKKSDTLAM